jgi:hypothetical protein
MPLGENQHAVESHLPTNQRYARLSEGATEGTAGERAILPMSASETDSA